MTDTHLAGGHLLAAITSRIVSLVREHYGRGPLKAKSYVNGDMIVCVLEDGFTAVEKTMADSGQEDKVLDMRRTFQDTMTGRYSEVVEELSGRTVRAFLSQTHVDPDLTVAIFLLNGPVPGFASLEEMAH